MGYDPTVLLRELAEKSTIEEKHLLSEAKVWDNYKNDYKPLIEFAKEKKLNVVACNVPRRYANLVFRKGVEALNELPEASLFLPAPAAPGLLGGAA